MSTLLKDLPEWDVTPGIFEHKPNHDEYQAELDGDWDEIPREWKATQYDNLTEPLMRTETKSESNMPSQVNPRQQNDARTASVRWLHKELENSIDERNELLDKEDAGTMTQDEADRLEYLEWWRYQLDMQLAKLEPPSAYAELAEKKAAIGRRADKVIEEFGL